jgi:hypothetical protein
LCRCTRSPLVPLRRPLSLHHLQITGEPPPPHRRPFLVQGGLHGLARWMRGASLMLIAKTLRSLVTHRTTAGHIAPAPSSRSKHQHRVLCVHCSPPPPLGQGRSMWAAGPGRPGAVLLGHTTMWPGQAGWLRAVRARPHASFGPLARDSIKIIFHFQIQFKFKLW